MSDSTDLEEIAALETRITSALDRIARGIAARGQAGRDDSGDREEIAELHNRVSALTAALEETQEALGTEQAANADLQERLRALDAARQADADEAARARAALAEELEAARSQAAAPEDDGTQSELEEELAHHREVETVLRRRIHRLREERNVMRGERNATVEQLEEVQGKLDQLQALVDSSAPEASGELARLRESNRVLRDTVEEMREAMAGGAEYDSDLVMSALAAELESLKADRAAEAAEARAILSEIRPVLEGGQADA